MQVRNTLHIFIYRISMLDGGCHLSYTLRAKTSLPASNKLLSGKHFVLTLRQKKSADVGKRTQNTHLPYSTLFFFFLQFCRVCSLIRSNTDGIVLSLSVRPTWPGAWPVLTRVPPVWGWWAAGSDQRRRTCAVRCAATPRPASRHPPAVTSACRPAPASVRGAAEKQLANYWPLKVNSNYPRMCPLWLSTETHPSALIFINAVILSLVNWTFSLTCYF